MTDFSDNNRFTPPRAALAEPGSLVGGPVLAGRGMRLVAVIMDGILMSLLVWPLYFMFGGAGLASSFVPGATPPNPFALMGAMFGAMVPGYIVAALVQAWSLHTFGGTLGKKIFGLRIVRTDGSRATVVRLFFGRGGVAILPSVIPFLGGLWVLADTLMIFRDSRQCLHDQIADTMVVTAASSMDASLAASKSG